MQYQILHSLEYRYDRPVQLMPHTIRLQPRSDNYQTLEAFQLSIRPTPLGQSTAYDALGNLVTRCWWSPEDRVDLFQVQASSSTRSHCDNPFHYMREPWANHLPFDYPQSTLLNLSPYFSEVPGRPQPSGLVTEWAQELAYQGNGNVISFLSALNDAIHQNCRYQLREHGEPFPPHLTWQRKEGSCRDFVVLFMAACAAVGLASRFVSGYEQGDPDYEQTLHAWAEVYLPGAGWRGYDPTMGLLVCDRHVALAANPLPRLTTPVEGGHHGQAKAEMQHKVTIQAIA